MASPPELPPARAGLGPLADPARFHEPIRLPDGEGGWLDAGLRRMILIRAAEELVGDMVAAGRVGCPCHLGIGQEAPPVALARHVRNGDRVFGAHRSHPLYLALGGSLRALMAELQGRATGASRGFGGSMHLIDPAHGLYGTVPIVGATIAIATGAALAARLDRGTAIAVSVFGDGATDEGVFHESLNLAAARQLPVLFLCENNLFSSHLHIRERQPSDSVARFAEAHRVPWETVDGNDLVALDAAIAAAVGGMRNGGGPRFIEAVTYRWRGHVGPGEDEGVGVGRQQDLSQWKARCPIDRLAAALTRRGDLTERALADLRRGARGEVAAAWAAAESDPYPTAEALLGAVYADRSG